MYGNMALVRKWGERKKLAPKHFSAYQRGINSYNKKELNANGEF